MSQVINEAAEVVGITLQYATTKHAQTFGMLERTHTSLKKTVKIETGERRSLWHNYVNIEVLNYDISYHKSIGYEPSTAFHGRFACDVLDLKQGIRPQRKSAPNSQIEEAFLIQTDMNFYDNRKNTMQAYMIDSYKYKAYLDEKSQCFETQGTILCVRATGSSRSPGK